MFTGDHNNVCDCYEKEECFSVLYTASNQCNCDNGDIVQREDQIRISDKVCMSKAIFLQCFNLAAVCL